MNHVIHALVATLVLTALAGCTAFKADCASTGGTDFTGKELKVLDHGAWATGALAEVPAYGVAKAVFEERTGAKLVQISGDDAGSALRQVIDSKGNPVADVIYGVDNALFFTGAEADVFEAYESPLLERIDASVVRVDDFRHHGLLLATPVDHGYVSVNYDAKIPAAAGPRTLQDLAKPEWASKFVVEDPRLSSPGLGFLIASVATFGESDTYDYLDFWKDLFDRDVLVAKDWTEAYVVHFTAGYGQYEQGFVGDRSVVVSYTTSPAVEAFYAGSPPSRSLDVPLGVFHQVETAAILKCTKNVKLAQVFIDILLEDAYQSKTSETMAVYPVVRDAPVIQNFNTDATAPRGLTPAPFTSDQLHEGIPRWLDAWTDLYQDARA